MVEFSQRTPDGQYAAVLQRILDHGEWSETRQGPRALTLMQQTMTFDLSNGYPVIVDRDISSFWSKAIGELCAFMNGATTVEELASFGCDWWAPWASEKKTQRRGLEVGDLGPGSYGGAFHDFPADGEPFDQFAHLVEQLRQYPSIRTHFVSPWIPQYLTRVGTTPPRATIAPCHGWVHVRVLGGRLHLHMFQRSGDVPVGVPSNMVQYSALMLMLSNLTGLPPATYYHTISDAHIYENQVDASRELAARAPRRLGMITLTDEGKAVSDIHDYRAEHFSLVEYDPHPSMPRIPVAV
ncbi:thymidylate synthase [Nocardioides endophyticus]|uniref:Thymidylate synthase n=1 Tax=Nocardioides endophyticus TaxID=1353775 RepID=A0ABP8Z0A2_9ACTN